MKLNFFSIKTKTLGGLLTHLLVMVILIIVLSLLYFFAYLPRKTNHLQSITVPNIEGLLISQLENELGKRTLRFEVNDSSYNANYPPLTVLRQYPHAGSKVKEGRKIFVSINRLKPPTVPIPDLIDGSVVNADAVLRSNELKRGNIELVAGPFNIVKEMKFQGQVIQPGERIPKGSTIDLVVMDGGNKEVEGGVDVLDLSLEDAKVIIFGSNLNLGKVTPVGDAGDPEKMIVLKQKPAPKENMRVGDIVDLWIGLPGTLVPDTEEEDPDYEDD